MKKILLIIFTLLLCYNAKAQTPLTEAVDFVATDCHGEQIHLFEILDRGQYVLLDFFFYGCQPCQVACPKIVEAYEALGCNQHDVFFIEISFMDSDASCQAWAEEYGVEYPTIGANGGGAQIDMDYGLSTYPTVILIAPNREIVLQNIFPIVDANTIIDALAPFGIQEYECSEEASPSVEISVGEVTTTSIEATFTPNEDCAKYHLLADTQENMDMWTGMMGTTLDELVIMWGLEKSSEYTHTWSDFAPNTEYTIYALPKDSEGNAGELVTTKVTTAQAGGAGVSVIDLEVIIVNDSTVTTIATPNAETASYHYGLMEKAYFDEIGEDAAVQYFREDPYVFYEVDEWTWTPLYVNTEFVAIATGQNSEGEWGETTIVHFKTPGGVGCAELTIENFKIYPNPTSSYINIISDVEEIYEIIIFDMTGRCVKKSFVSDNKTTIDLSDINKGVYFININGTTEKLIVQ